MDSEVLARVLMGITALVLSGAVHEYAHAWTAFKLGDDTAAREGRLTLNPIVHIDPVGSLILPGLMLLSGPMFLGWARPVPFNPVRFTRRVRMKTGTMLTALAGPMANIALALGAGFGFTAARWAGVDLIGAADGTTAAAIGDLLWMLLYLNVVLAILNLIPLPPLDGHKVALGLLPDREGRRFDEVLARNREFVLIGLLAVLFLGSDIIFAPVEPIAAAILSVTGAL